MRSTPSSCLHSLTSVHLGMVSGEFPRYQYLFLSTEFSSRSSLREGHHGASSEITAMLNSLPAGSRTR